MKKLFLLTGLILCLSFCLMACGSSVPYNFVSTLPTIDATNPTELPIPPKPEHSALYIEDLAVEDVITYFNEVCLDAEYSGGSGNPALVQKWDIPIRYRIAGSYTEKDLQVLDDFCTYLNTINGFPGIREAADTEFANLHIHFTPQSTIVSQLGNDFINSDGAVTYWYDTDGNNIYEATIYIRSDMEQNVRNSVIQEEIYNGLGATQDSDLREDSIIYSGYSTPQELTAVDRLIIELLYHPDIHPGMNSTACKTVIRELYY